MVVEKCLMFLKLNRQFDSQSEQLRKNDLWSNLMLTPNKYRKDKQQPLINK